jgi:hypothetical protein
MSRTPKTARVVATITVVEDERGDYHAEASVGVETKLSTGPWYTRRGCLDGLAQRWNEHLLEHARTRADW